MKKTTLFMQAIAKFLLGVALVGLLLFLPAGSFEYTRAWWLMAVLFVPMFLAGLVMLVKSPQLLRLRLESKEKQQDQAHIIKISGLMFLLGFVLSGLGFRFDFYTLPKVVSMIAAGVFLVSYALYGWVLKANVYLSRTIQVQENQTVVTTGPYRVVRHPMYSATVLLFLSIPLILGSLYAFLVFLIYPVLIVKRILLEEAFLARELDGYTAYQQTVKYRLIPFIW